MNIRRICFGGLFLSLLSIPAMANRVDIRGSGNGSITYASILSSNCPVNGSTPCVLFDLISPTQAQFAIPGPSPDFTIDGHLNVDIFMVPTSQDFVLQLPFANASYGSFGCGTTSGQIPMVSGNDFCVNIDPNPGGSLDLSAFAVSGAPNSHDQVTFSFVNPGGGLPPLPSEWFIYVDHVSPVATREPGTLLMLATGLLGMVALSLKRAIT
jgi:hypothetical protein